MGTQSKVGSLKNLSGRCGRVLRRKRRFLRAVRVRGITITNGNDPEHPHEKFGTVLTSSRKRITFPVSIPYAPSKPSRSKYAPHVGTKQLRKSWKPIEA